MLPFRGPLTLGTGQELLSVELLEDHARRLAAVLSTSPARRRGGRAHLRQLKGHMRALRHVYTTLAEDARSEAMSPAAEWLLDNFHVITAAARDIHHDLPPAFFRRLPRSIVGSCQECWPLSHGTEPTVRMLRAATLARAVRFGTAVDRLNGYAGIMTLEHMKATIAAGWWLSACAVALTGHVSSVTGWSVLVAFALLPPFALMRFANPRTSHYPCSGSWGQVMSPIAPRVELFEYGQRSN